MCTLYILLLVQRISCFIDNFLRAGTSALFFLLVVVVGIPVDCVYSLPQIKLKQVLREHFARHEAAGKSTRAIVFTHLRDSVEASWCCPQSPFKPIAQTSDARI